MASNRHEAVQIVDNALRNVGLSLEEVSRRYPHELSGGQVQRVSVARALIPQPRVILADEPVSMVDASLRMEIVNLFRKLQDEQKVSVVYITHDLATAYYVSDRIAIMLRGCNSSIVVDSVKKAIPKIQASLPKDVRITPFYDCTALIQACIETVAKALRDGAIFRARL
jgi:ABC-type oligopeptide transport system ATPase subunit